MKYCAYAISLCTLVFSCTAYALHKRELPPLANSAYSNPRYTNDPHALFKDPAYSEITFSTCLQNLNNEESFATALSMLYNDVELRTRYLKKALSDGSMNNAHHTLLIKTSLVITPEFELGEADSSDIIRKNLELLEERSAQRRSKMRILLEQATRDNVLHTRLLQLQEKQAPTALQAPPAQSPTQPSPSSCDQNRGPLNEEEIALLRSMLAQDPKVRRQFFYEQMKEIRQERNIQRLLCLCLEDNVDTLMPSSEKQTNSIKEYKIFLENYAQSLMADTQPRIQADHLGNLLEKLLQKASPATPFKRPAPRSKTPHASSSKKLCISNLCSSN
jgi:hypothetical protein